MPVDPMPSLAPIRALAAPNTDHREKMAVKLSLVRAVNYVNHSLLQAIRLLQREL